METVKKKLPYELYDVAGLEEWFAQMAAEGLHLVRCGDSKATFSVSTPKANVRFRLESQGVYETDLNKNEAYAQAGWEHVTTIRSFFYVYRNDDPTAEELHTDPATQSYSMRSLVRRHLWSLLFLPLWYIWIFRDEVELLFTSPGQLPMDFVRYDSMILLYILLLIVFLHSIITAWQQFSILRQIKKRLADGLPIDRKKRYPRSFFRHGFRWLLLGGSILVFVLAVHMENRADAPDFTLADCPHVTLEQVVAPLPLLAHPRSMFSEGTTLHASTLVPMQLTFGQTGLIGEGTDETNVRIYLYYDQTRSPVLARLLMRGHISELTQYIEEANTNSNMLYRDGPVALSTLTELDHPAFDELYYLDYTYKKSDLPQRAYFALAGTQSIHLIVSQSLAERALELLAAQLGSP